MRKESVEEYLGAIYRLQEVADGPLPLSRLQTMLKISPISIHEMVQKLEKEAMVTYIPYRGVNLTEGGNRVAAALVRRHRIWERFLTDSLGIAWDKAHEIAGELEHAAPESVTDRLLDFLGDPQFCPHGSQIPANDQTTAGQHPMRLTEPPAPVSQCLENVAVGAKAKVAFISLEAPEYLQALQAFAIKPGTLVTLIGHHGSDYQLEVEGNQVEIPAELAGTVWVNGV